MRQIERVRGAVHSWRRRLLGYRRPWLTAAALGISLTAGVALPQQVRPNIVVLMVDDLDANMASAMIQSGLAPNLKAHLADRGVTFSQTFCTTPVCTPSRATLLTGRYAHNHGAARNESPFGGVTALDDRSTLATWLQASGYRTGYVGKYLNGYGRSDINRDGVFNAADTGYVPPGWNQWFGLLDPYDTRMYQFVANENGSVSAWGTAAADYQTDVIAGKAVTFLERFEAADDNAPFFLAITPAAPHQEVYPGLPVSDYSDAWRWTIRPAPRHAGTVLLPLPQPPSLNEADMSDKPAWMQLRPALSPGDIANLTQQYRDRVGSVRAVDDLVGSLVTRLAELGELSRTVLIFTSDNGFFHGEHRLPQKLTAHEESIRIPLIVAAPWLSKAEARQMILNTDFAPTIAEMAGVTAGHVMDGTSFAPLLREPGRPRWRRRFLVERWPGAPSIFELPAYFAVRTGSDAPEAPDNTLIHYAGGSREHYDLNGDPFQLNSLHADTAPIVSQRRAGLTFWLNRLIGCAGAGCRDSEFHPPN